MHGNMQDILQKRKGKCITYNVLLNPKLFKGSFIRSTAVCTFGKSSPNLSNIENDPRQRLNSVSTVVTSITKRN